MHIRHHCTARQGAILSLQVFAQQYPPTGKRSSTERKWWTESLDLGRFSTAHSPAAGPPPVARGLAGTRPMKSGISKP